MLISSLASSRRNMAILRAPADTSSTHSACSPTKRLSFSGTRPRLRWRDATKRPPPKPSILPGLSRIRHKLFAGWQSRNITPTAPARPSVPGNARWSRSPIPRPVEERSNQQESRHFSLRYEGGETSLALQRDMLGILEDPGVFGPDPALTTDSKPPQKLPFRESGV
jgi:hypothetical protein